MACFDASTFVKRENLLSHACHEQIKEVISGESWDGCMRGDFTTLDMFFFFTVLCKD